MGGTFDPVHTGHLLIAELARDTFDLDPVFFIPAGDPPHKPDDQVTTAEHRFAMVQLAVERHPQFRASRMELDRAGASFTVDTLRDFHAQGYDAEELYLIVGIDSALDLLAWRSPEEIVRLCTIVSVARPGYDSSALEGRLPARYRKSIRVVEGPTLALSSTEIRQRVRQGRSIRYLVPESVDEYIGKEQLYFHDEGA